MSEVSEGQETEPSSTAPQRIVHREIFSLRRSLRRWFRGAVLLGIAYTAIVAGTASHDVLWNWFHTLSAIVVSVMLAMATGLLIYDRQNTHEAASERLDDLHVLRYVLLEYRQTLSSNRTQRFELWQFKGNALITYFDPGIFESIARQGKHDPRFSLFLVQVATAARMFNIRVQHFLNLAAATSAASGGGSHLLKNAAEDLAYARMNLWSLSDALFNNVEALLHDPSFRLGEHVVLNRHVPLPDEVPPNDAV